MATIVGEEALLLHKENASGRYVVGKAWNIQSDRELTAAEANLTRLTKMLKTQNDNKRGLMKEVDVYAGRTCRQAGLARSRWCNFGPF
eukprot:8601830-Pyramimonas_sp.AAC.1